MSIIVKKYYLIILYSLIIILGIEVLCLNSFKPKENYERSIMINMEDDISHILNNMSLEEKIGQLLIITNNSNVFDEETKNLLEQVKPGGFILMEPNFSNYDNTKKYINSLKKYSKIPLIISIDEEGGIVQRLKYLKDLQPINIPSMYNLGSTNDKNLAYQVGQVIAEEVRTLGINVVYAPVVDVYSNPDNTVIGDRSFSNNPYLVSKMANALAQGLENNEVIATYKHFPGHGDTIIDSHDDLPLIDKDYQSLLNLELIPFKEAIKNKAKIIMIGHLALPNITGDNTPASLSKKIIDILKNKLDYQGLIITDALNMGALTKYYDDSTICSIAINAGNDLLLMPNNIDICINDIKNNVSEDRINESVLKILKFKYKYLRKDNSLEKKYLNSKKHQKIIEKIK